MRTRIDGTNNAVATNRKQRTSMLYTGKLNCAGRQDEGDKTAHNDIRSRDSSPSCVRVLHVTTPRHPTYPPTDKYTFSRTQKEKKTARRQPQEKGTMFGCGGLGRGQKISER